MSTSVDITMIEKIEGISSLTEIHVLLEFKGNYPALYVDSV